MAKGKLSSQCQFCTTATLKSQCFEHCHESNTGKHEPNPFSAQAADEQQWVIDFTCKHCGASGSVSINPDDIAFA